MLISSVAVTSFKPLSPETIKAQTTKRTVGASICQNQDTLSQCSRPGAKINLEAARGNLRGDEVEMKL
jgi:hypothetical protein